MSDSTTTVPSAKRGFWIAALLPWLLFAAGCVACLCAVVISISEGGDPPYTANDNWQRAAIIGCPLFFALASIWAVVARSWIVAVLIAAAGTGWCLLGWQIVHWDIPKLFP